MWPSFRVDSEEMGDGGGKIKTEELHTAASMMDAIRVAAF